MAFHKRKQFWIDAPMQLQMLGYVLLLVACSLLLVSFSVLRGLAAATAETHTIFHNLDWIRETMRGPAALSSLLAILASGLLTLIWSHRFAGPLRVLSAAMARLKHGNFSVPTKIRATDTHQELVKEFAQMQDGLRLMLQEDHAKVHKALGTLTHLAEKSHGEDAAKLHSAIEDLKAVGAKYHL